MPRTQQNQGRRRLSRLLFWPGAVLFQLLFPLLAVGGAILGIILLPVGGRRSAVFLMRQIGRAVLWLLRVLQDVDCHEQGRENLPDGPFIIAAKHQSSFDTQFYQASIGRGCAYIAKKELAAIPFLGWMLRHMGTVFIDRNSGSAIRTMVAEARRSIFELGNVLVIFPEGTRSRPGSRGRYRSGVWALYEAFGIPVVPVATNSGLFWPRHRFLKRPGTISVVYLPAIRPGMPRSAFMAHLEEAIETRVRDLVDRAGEDTR